jgi:hypothetical protein
MSDDEADAGPVPDIKMTPIDMTKKTVQFKLPAPLKLADFEQGVTLGTGSFGRVTFVTHKVLIWKLFYFYLQFSQKVKTPVLKLDFVLPKSFLIDIYFMPNNS